MPDTRQPLPRDPLFYAGERSFLLVALSMAVLPVVAGFALFRWIHLAGILFILTPLVALTIAIVDLVRHDVLSRAQGAPRWPNALLRLFVYGLVFVAGTPLGLVLGFIFAPDDG